MDQNDYGFSVDTALGRPHRRDSPYYGRDSFGIFGNWRGGRVLSQRKRRSGDGDRGEFRDCRKRDRTAKTFPGEVTVGADAEERRHFHRLHARPVAHALSACGNRSEDRSLDDDDRLHSHRPRHAYFAFPDSTASVTLQVKKNLFISSFFAQFFKD